MLRDRTLEAGDGVVRFKQVRHRLGDLLADGKLRLPGVGIFNSSSAFAKAIKGKRERPSSTSKPEAAEPAVHAHFLSGRLRRRGGVAVSASRHDLVYAATFLAHV